MAPRGILVDSNVLLDVLGDDQQWYAWSSAQLTGCAEKHSLFINPIIYSEVSMGFDRIEDLEIALPSDHFRRLSIPWEAAFLAGKVFLKYRRAGGSRLSPLPDFFIGAHAVIEGMVLLTRDSRRYRTYFPALRLISPQF